MRDFFLKTLFSHYYFVHQGTESDENAAEVRLALANLCGIRIIKGAELLQMPMLHLADEILGKNVPLAFYRGFPDSVLELPVDALLFDQLLHYYRTYDLGDYSEPGHSLFEAEEIERKAFRENIEIRDFSVITEEEAEIKLRGYVEDLFAGSRQLSDEQYELVLEYMGENQFIPETCGSKNTVIRLLADTRIISLAGMLVLSDVPKLAEELNYRTGGKPGFKKLNLKNQDRKFITAVLDELIGAGKIDTRSCYEKKAVWSGLLHHIHYRTTDPAGIEFLSAMRGDENKSVLSDFEAILEKDGAAAAADFLARSKGSGALLRNMDYLLSRCGSDQEIEAVISKIKTDNAILLVQLLLHYAGETVFPRTFKFTRHGKLTVHDETPAETVRRKTVLANRDRKAALHAVRELMKKTLHGRLGKVYIDPAMKNAALPIQEGASQGGFGTLPRGTRIPLPEGKKIRGFTYWEQVNDIDLSVIGLDDQLRQQEFSWRTMAGNQSAEITFSGDQTSGYNGGAEFFDVNTELFKVKHPKIRYLVFCDNVFTRGMLFSQCICRAGYMLRDIDDSGEIFEPKTVQSSFSVTCGSSFAYLFALDLQKNEFVWLNIANESRSRIAGMNNLRFLVPYLEAADLINVYDCFSMLASEIVEDPLDADTAVTDEQIEAGENTEIIRSYDTERMIALLNGK